MVDEAALADELKRLRKGQAARHPTVPARVGPHLRRLCGITETDQPASVRAKLTGTIERLLAAETAEVRLTLLAALALHPDARQQTLQARQEWLAQRLHVNERTARRRVDGAVGLLLAAALAELLPAQQPAAALADPWRVRSLDALLRLDTDGPQLTERRTVVFTADHVEELTCQISVPKLDGNTGREHHLLVEAQYGVQIGVRERPADDHFRYRLRLPRTFNTGDAHEYVMTFQIPSGQPMANHYVMQPLTPCDSFELTVRFQLDRVPQLVWLLDGVAPRIVDSDRPNGDPLQSDRLGEIHISFQHLRQGRAYGLKWRWTSERMSRCGDA